MNEVNYPNHLQEDEIDLRELFKTIKKGWYIILLVVILSVSGTVAFVLSQPNSYKSDMVLIPASDGSSGTMSSLSGLAAMAGVSLPSSGSMTPDVAFQSLLTNYEFMRNFVIKHQVVEHYEDKNLDKNFVFAMNNRSVYDYIHKSKDENKKQSDPEEKIFNTVKSVSSKFTISADKKTSLLTISYEDNDRFYTAQMLNDFLNDASAYLIAHNLKNLDNSLSYYQTAIQGTQSIEVRQALSQTISKLIQQRVVMKSKEYFQCDPLTKPSVPYIKDKTKPKRGLIVVVSFVTSIILGIFLVFFISFIRSNKE
jgi:uncharacterized protein involved in exopolysaccharide biosynthesis